MRKRKGEGYIELCVGVLVFVMAIVIVMNIFSLISLRITMDRIADNLIEAATDSGAFSSEYADMKSAMQEDYYYFDTTESADSYFNTGLGRVQLGDKMTVTVTVETTVKGIGSIGIPVTLTVTKTGLSEKYWK